mgnify:CR=1 FL=1|jgi:hypothetical protein|tara:strand:- start:945 stop:1301 length:357 start_codon:yes stop_codon:yes gene_type:complete
MAGLGEGTPPRVFIGSTVRDLHDLRSALHFWLGELGYDCFLSEYNDSDRVLGPGTYETCFERIRSSDLYVLLIGYQRGSLIGLDPARSITEAGYDEAYESHRAMGKPRLLPFIRKDVA